MYIVELEENCWLACWSGDPGRTCIRYAAKEYATVHGAAVALGIARRYHPFPNAKVYPMKVDTVVIPVDTVSIPVDTVSIPVNTFVAVRHALNLLPCTRINGLDAYGFKDTHALARELVNMETTKPDSGEPT